MQAQPWLESTRLSSFDCEKDNSAFKVKPGFLSVRRYNTGACYSLVLYEPTPGDANGSLLCSAGEDGLTVGMRNRL